MKDKPSIKVAVGVVLNNKGEVLIAERPLHVLGGGYWEFPGGKIEEGESEENALVRELREEVNIEVLQSTPFLEIEHEYPERHIMLFARLVKKFRGEAKGLEGQIIQWVVPDTLTKIKMLPANQEIITAILASALS